MNINNIEYILDHYKNPRNYGALSNPDVSHEKGNPSCGDTIRLDLSVENNRVKEVGFTGKGCSISQAAASMLTENIIGKDLDKIKSITENEMLEMLNSRISPIRFKCALLALRVLKSALYGIKDKQGKEC